MLTIDGKKLRLLLARTGRRQRDVAQASGMNKYTLNRWCNNHISHIQQSTLEQLACGLGVDSESLIREIGAGETVSSDLSPAEAEIVQAFRSLSPIEQAKVLVAFDESVNQAKASRESRQK